MVQRCCCLLCLDAEGAVFFHPYLEWHFVWRATPASGGQGVVDCLERVFIDTRSFLQGDLAGKEARLFCAYSSSK